ncbi:MAG: hypothetical protein HY908_34300 [Myxococcales bacterium]|nr:hypothetical protein [Myxococcales bacterium]
MSKDAPTTVFEDAYDASHPAALALYCSDGRFTRAVERLMQHLGHDRLDTLTMPGGPALLETKSAALVEVGAVRSALTFLVEGHHIRELLLVAHAGCGYYRRRYPIHEPAQIHAQQLADLRAAAAWARRALTVASIDLFYATTEHGRVAFHAVPVD